MESRDQTEPTSDSEDAHDQPGRQARETSPPSASRTNPGSYTTGGKIALVSAVGLSLSALLPWVSLNVELLSLSITAVGIDTAGVFTLPAGVLIAAGIVYSPSQWRRGKFFTVIIVSGIGGLIGIAYVIDPTIGVDPPQGISQEDIRPFMNTEIGIYATLLSSIGVAVGSVLARYS